ncbi:hypothetical protein AMECASPLE_028109 [Ameca splendens]|uniref:Uncharacterized protein n=1 Tax=Ameca splendens TaxID=208324 RepID=A0ABV0YT56_9TELE
MFLLKPLHCCFKSMLLVIVLLEGEHLSQSQITGRLTQFCSKISLYLAPTIFPSTQQPSLGWLVVVPCAFYLNMMDLMVLQGKIEDLDIFHNPALALLNNFVLNLYEELLSLHGVMSLV